MAIQTHHTVYSHASSSPSLLVATPIHYDRFSIVLSPIDLNSSFVGTILGTSKDNLSVLGKIVSIFAEVSGEPYGTAIDLRSPTKRIRSRRMVLHLHRNAVHFLHEQHQHLRRHQRTRSGTIDRDRLLSSVHQHRRHPCAAGPQVRPLAHGGENQRRGARHACAEDPGGGQGEQSLPVHLSAVTQLTSAPLPGVRRAMQQGAVHEHQSAQ